jgi:hypothetical protein
VILVAMALWDLARRRRLHPAFVGGAALIIAGETAASVLYWNAGWRGFTAV